MEAALAERSDRHDHEGKGGVASVVPGTCALPARRCACHDGKAVGSKQQATAPVCRGLAGPVVTGPWTRDCRVATPAAGTWGWRDPLPGRCTAHRHGPIK